MFPPDPLSSALLLSTLEAEAPSSSSRLSSGWMVAGRRLSELELQSMESVCLVFAILDLYMVGVNSRNCGLALHVQKLVRKLDIPLVSVEK